jgi:uncharacterized protein with NAD-binding domain and iron-sulfur cluster
MERRKVAILGGGMGGLAAAWRLSEPGWRDDFESITVYQRGWRLGGKGASSRGPNGRIEEHGLHVWLGWYENAFRFLRECYEELDRESTRPGAPIRTLSDAFIPSNEIGLVDRSDESWKPWVTDLPDNSRRPGGPGTNGRDTTLVDLGVQTTQLLARYFDTLRPPSPDRASNFGTHPREASGEAWGRTRLGMMLTMAALRGIAADGLLTDPHGLAAINDEEYMAWIRRHGGPAELADFSVVRAIYDMVFGFVDGDTARPSVGAGTAVLFGGKTLFDYKGSIFWKMRAGMGDVVFAPIYEALCQRGVAFEFFHRVDQLQPSKDGKRIEAIVVGRQARLAKGCTSYEPLVAYRGLPCFPSKPRLESLSDAAGIEGQRLESHWCRWPDVERRVLRDGTDFDVVVFAIPPGMARFTCADLATQQPHWRDMFDQLGTVATQSFQIWLRDSELDLGWSHGGSTVSAFIEPFSTWASMPQLLEFEEWPTDSAPKTVAYFCGALPGAVPARRSDVAREFQAVRQTAIDFLQERLPDLLPGTADRSGFRWDLLCSENGHVGSSRFDSQYWTANVDPSDRYVQSLPGTDRFRFRSDESGYDNLFLAGDWTDSGLNAGCIESAVLSGLQAANAIHLRPRNHRILGYFMP